MVVSPVLLSEFDHVARRVLGPCAAHQAIDELAGWARAGRVLLPQISHRVLGNVQAVRVRYTDLRLDLADAVHVVLAAEFGTDAVLTLDRRDFRAVTPLTHHQAFRLLPTTLDRGPDPT